MRQTVNHFFSRILHVVCCGYFRFGSYQVDNHHLAAVLLQALSKPAGRATSFSASPAQADSQQPASPSVSALKQSMIRVQPHALDSHVPALCGPLQANHHQSLCICMGLGHCGVGLGVCESDYNLLCG